MLARLIGVLARVPYITLATLMCDLNTPYYVSVTIGSFIKSVVSALNQASIAVFLGEPIKT